MKTAQNLSTIFTTIIAINNVYTNSFRQYPFGLRALVPRDEVQLQPTPHRAVGLRPALPRYVPKVGSIHLRLQ